MTVKELKKELIGIPDNTEVFLVKDWEVWNENGELTELAELRSVCTQRIVIDEGLDFRDEKQVLLDFSE